MVIRPFGTYENGGMGHSVADLKRLCPKAQITEGLFIRGSDIKNEFSVIEKWIYANGSLPELCVLSSYVFSCYNINYETILFLSKAYYCQTCFNKNQEVIG